MGALVFWGVVAISLVGGTVLSRRRRRRRIERFAASGDLHGLNIDGHERSNNAIATGEAWSQQQQGQFGSY